MSRWPRKNYRGTQSTANIVEVDFAPSVEEADAILARFGYAEREAVAA